MLPTTNVQNERPAQPSSIYCNIYAQPVMRSNLLGYHEPTRSYLNNKIINSKEKQEQIWLSKKDSEFRHQTLNNRNGIKNRRATLENNGMVVSDKKYNHQTVSNRHYDWLGNTCYNTQYLVHEKQSSSIQRTMKKSDQNSQSKIDNMKDSERKQNKIL